MRYPLPLLLDIRCRRILPHRLSQAGSNQLLEVQRKLCQEEALTLSGLIPDVATFAHSAEGSHVRPPQNVLGYVSDVLIMPAGKVAMETFGTAVLATPDP
jgi:hypothetical protein